LKITKKQTLPSSLLFVDVGWVVERLLPQQKYRRVFDVRRRGLKSVGRAGQVPRMQRDIARL
jgi:hypothetical protein